MTLTANDQYLGRCPVCSAQLLEADGILTCAATPGHFNIKEKIFAAAWDKFDHSAIQTDGLMTILLGGNEAEEKPTLLQIIERLKIESEA